MISGIFYPLNQQLLKQWMKFKSWMHPLISPSLVTSFPDNPLFPVKWALLPVKLHVITRTIFLRWIIATFPAPTEVLSFKAQPKSHSVHKWRDILIPPVLTDLHVLLTPHVSGLYLNFVFNPIFYCLLPFRTPRWCHLFPNPWHLPHIDDTKFPHL